MNDEEFLDYCHAHADTPRCGFVPEHLARLLRLAGREDVAKRYDGLPVQVLDCGPAAIRELVAEARSRAPETAQSAAFNPGASS